MYWCVLKTLFLMAGFLYCRGTDVASLGADPYVCTKQTDSTVCVPKARRYDITDLGYEQYFHGWADVQGQGATNDYCRIIGEIPNHYLSCALAGSNGKSQYNYNSTKGIDLGYGNTWYMKDEDGDGRDDYCRCVGSRDTLRISCTKAGERGFFGAPEQGGNSYTFSVQKFPCSSQKVRPEFGRPYP